MWDHLPHAVGLTACILNANEQSLYSATVLLVVVSNSARVAGLTALAAPSSTTCVFAARLADASSPS